MIYPGTCVGLSCVGLQLNVVQFLQAPGAWGSTMPQSKTLRGVINPLLARTVLSGASLNLSLIVLHQ
jgi:hypothetical protein